MRKKSVSKNIYMREQCLCVHVYSGITSRCICLMDAYHLAKEYNISNLIIIWQLEKWCNIKYDDVFDEKQFEDINVMVVEYSPFGIDFGEGIKVYMKRKEFGNVLHCLGQWLHFFGKKIFNRKAEHIIKYFKDNSRYVRYDPPVEIGWEGVGYTIWQNGCWQRVKGYLDKRINFCAGIYCGLIKGEQTDVCSDAIAFRQDLCDKAKQIVGNNFVGCTLDARTILMQLGKVLWISL